MALHLIYGNSGSGKSEYIYEKVIDMAQQKPQKNFYVVVPEQFTLQTQKELVRRQKNHVILNIDVVSFERLAYRVFDELGVCHTVMEETGKSLVLRRIAEQKAENLTILKGNIRRMGYIGEVKSMISELMQYGISSEDLEEFLKKLNDQSSLYYKLQDICQMYQSFEEYLKGRYVTAEKVLDVLREVSTESALLKGSVLVFDGFTGFTPVQFQLLRRLMHVVRDMYVTVTFDVREDPLQDKGIQELFYMSRKMVRGLLHAAEEERFEIAQPAVIKYSKESRFGNNPVLAHLEQNLFREKSLVYHGNMGGRMAVYSLASPKEELSFAACRICQLMQEGDYRYSDFAIVSGDVAGYENYAKSVFPMYGIPYFADTKKDILYHPLIELIRAALELVERNYSYESVFRLLKTGLAGFSAEETDLLENYVVAKGVRGDSRWGKKFLKPMRRHGKIRQEEEKSQEQLAVLNRLRERFYRIAHPLYQAFHTKNATVRDWSSALYQFLCDLEIEKQLLDAQEVFSEKGQEELASQYRQIYPVVIDLLDKMVDLLGEETLSVQEYADVLETGFSAAKIGVIPPGSDSVILGDIERTRLDGIKVLFFLGVNDGVIPKSGGSGGILSQYDREVLEEQKLTLSPTIREQQFIQKFYLYLNMTKPSDALYLTCARMSADGKSVRPSYLIGTICRMFPEIAVKEIDATRPLPAVTVQNGLQSYLIGLLRAKEDEISEEWKALHHWFVGKEEWKPVVERIFAAAFDSYQGDQLSAEIAKLLYGSVLTGSVTRLELFARCAYAHFLEYGLKLSERETYGFAAVDMGSMFHAILQRYCQELEESADWYTITEDEQDALLHNAMEETILSMPNEVLTESARSAYVLERIFRIMKRSVWALTEQIRHGSFRPVGYEVDFVQVSDLKLEDMVRNGEEQMRLIGRVDRIDTFENDEKIYVRIIDYKSGKTTFQLLNLYYGQQLQLVVYLNAAMEKIRQKQPSKEVVPGGIFYYRLDDPMVEDQNRSEEEIMQDILEQLRLNGLVNLSPEAYQHMDSALEGKSSVIPLTLKKDGSVSSRGTSGIGEAQFAQLGHFVEEKITKTAEKILSGDIGVHPIQLEQKTGCDYCPYKSICGFDFRIPGYGFDRKEKLTEDQIWQKIGEES